MWSPPDELREAAMITLNECACGCGEFALVFHQKEHPKETPTDQCGCGVAVAWIKPGDLLKLVLEGIPSIAKEIKALRPEKRERLEQYIQSLGVTLKTTRSPSGDAG